jgi:UDP-glucuronate 4-epimerase
LRFVDLIEAELGVEAIRDLRPMQPGDIEDSWADITALQSAVGYTPATSVEEGVIAWVQWYRQWIAGVTADAGV